jgi:hypothetical protein
LSAPSSPPETPIADEVQARAAHAFSRRLVSGNSALPPSMMMSPGSMSVGQLVDHRVGRAPALTMMIRRRGFSRAASEFRDRLARTNVPSEPCSASSASVFGVERLCTRDGIAVAGEVAGEVRAHHGQAGDSDLRGTGGAGRCA